MVRVDLVDLVGQGLVDTVLAEFSNLKFPLNTPPLAPPCPLPTRPASAGAGGMPPYFRAQHGPGGGGRGRSGIAPTPHTHVSIS